MTVVREKHQVDPTGDRRTAPGGPVPCPDPLPKTALAGLAALFALIAFIQSPGRIVDDTKLPVVMSPWAWIRGSLHLWTQTLGSGAVQDQGYGYLWPMAPFFELTRLLHVPVWVAERLWLAALLTVGAWGVIRLAEALGIGNRGARVLAALAFCTAPIVVDWAALSVDLLAVVFLPWVLHPLVVGARGGSPRRAAARSGVAVAFMGGVNATVIISALPLAVIWLLTRAPGPRRRALAGWWVVSLVLACFWWAFAFLLQGKYGYDFLPFTETANITTSTGSLFEALRGTTNWQNYYNLGGTLIPGGWTLVTNSVVIMATALLAALGLGGLARRVPERLFLVAGLSFGVLVISIGYAGALGGPFSPSVISLLLGSLGPLRNISKFSPDVALPLALGLAWAVSTASVEGIRHRVPHWLTTRRVRVGVTAIAAAALFVASAPFWQGDLYPPGGFSSIPGYWQQAANWLDAHQGHQTALLVPGAAFAEYTWGNPDDEPLNVLTTNSVNARDIIPLGTNGNTEMLSAVEDAIDTATPQPGLAQFLARSGIGYVIERNDLNLKATGALPPAEVHQVLTETPGLVQVAAFGPVLPTSQTSQGVLPVYDAGATLPRLRAVEIFAVRPAVAEVQTYPAADPLVVSGSVSSLLPLADEGVLNGRAAVLAKDPDTAGAASDPGATWVITDGNQRRQVAFGKVDDNLSYLYGPTEPSQSTPGVPLTYVPLGPPSSQTVAAPLGAAWVDASSYGSTALNLQTAQGPASAFDGDPTTAWVADSAKLSVGQWVAIHFNRPVDVTRIAITPLNDTPRRPSIRAVGILTDRGAVVRAIPEAPGPVWVTVAPGATENLRITILAAARNDENPKRPLGAGIVDVTVPGVTFHPAMQLPTDELHAFSGRPANTPVVVFDDQVGNANFDPGATLTTTAPFARRFTLPGPMASTVAGTAVPVPGPALEHLLGSLAPPGPDGLAVSASSTLGDLPRFSAQNLVDGSHRPWIAGLNDPHPSVTLRWDGERVVSSLHVGVTSAASRPVDVEVTSPTGSRTVRIPPTGGTVSFAPLATDTLTLRILTTAATTSVLPTGPSTVGLLEPRPVRLPVGLSSVSVPALSAAPAGVAATTPVRLSCGSGPSLEVDGHPVVTSVSATVANLVDLHPVRITACPSAALALAAGPHVVSFPSGSAFRVTGLVMDRRAPAVSATSAAAAAGRRPMLGVVSWSPVQRVLRLGAGPATYLQVAQTYNRGWTAAAAGRTLTPVSLDGWEQGWIVPAGSAVTVTMTFAPDHAFRAGLLVGALALLALFALAILPGRRRLSGPAPPRAALPEWLLATVAAIVVFCLGDVLVIVLLPLVLAARRWGSSLMAAIAAAAYVVAGVVVSVAPYPYVLGHLVPKGAFGYPAQALSLLALSAVLAAVVAGDRARAPRAPTPGPGASPGAGPAAASPAPPEAAPEQPADAGRGER